MPNKFASKPAQPSQLRAPANLPQGNLALPAVSGQADAEIAQVSAALASKVGAIADRAAAQEGARAGQQAGMDPSYRPSNLPTIRGMAYDRAGTETYLDTLDTALRQDIAKVADAHAGDPAGMQKAFAALGNEYRAQHVFPEIRPQFEGAFARLTLGPVREAANAARARARGERQAALEASLAEKLKGLQRDAYRLGLDGAADAALAGQMADIERSLAGVDAAGRRLVSPEAAAKTLGSARITMAEARIKGAFGQIESLADREAFLASLDDDYKNGKGATTAFTFDQYESLRRDLDVDLRRAMAQGAQATAAIGREVSDFEKLAQDGLAPPDDQLAGLAGRVAATGDASLMDRFTVADNRFRFLRAARTETPAALDGYATRLRDEIETKGASPEAAQRLADTEALLGRMRRGLAQDPLGWAQKAGTVAVAPLDFSSPEAAVGSLVARQASARQTAETYGIQPTYFRPDELPALAAIANAGGQPLLDMAGAIVEGLGPEHAGAAFAELGKEAPVLAQIGALRVSGAATSAMRDAAQGVAIMREQGFKALATGIEKPRLVESAYGNAFTLLPRTLGAVTQTADAIYEARARRLGKQEFDRDLYERALSEAAGEHEVNGEAYGGIARYHGRSVLVPPSMPQDGFADAVQMVTDADLAAVGAQPRDDNGGLLTAADLKAAMLVPIGGGRYLAALSDPDGPDPQYIADPGPNGYRTPDGHSLFVLDMGKLGPLLAKRASSLWLAAP